MLQRRTIGFVLGLGLVGLIVGSVGAAVLAQEATPEPETEISGPPGYKEFIEDLAANLGLPAEQVDAAFKDTLKQRVDERADRIKERLDAGDFRGWFGRGVRAVERRVERHLPRVIEMPRGTGRALFGMDRDLTNDIAEFIGITPRELVSELRQGSSLAEIAEAHGKTRDELKSFLLERAEARIDALIDAGSDGQSKPAATPTA